MTMELFFKEALKKKKQQIGLFCVSFWYNAFLYSPSPQFYQLPPPTIYLFPSLY